MTMCSAEGWQVTTARRARDRSGAAKRRLQEFQEIQVASVCLGIEHLINKRRRATKGGEPTRVSSPEQQTASPPFRDNTPDSFHRGRDQASSCRLCESTLRVLSYARLHGKRCRQRRQQQQQPQHRRELEEEANGDSSNTQATAAVVDCEACRMWSMVVDRCAVLGVPLPIIGNPAGGGGGGCTVGVAGRVENGRAASTTVAATASGDGADEAVLPPAGKVLYNE